jgi:ubiquinone/menaquinone biosynthesis C-methylase UbiE
MDPALIPPLAVRLGVGPFDDPQGYIDWGRHEFDRLVKYGGLTPGDTVLDIGCGCGRVAIHCAQYLTTGRYVGMDNLQPLIDWCNLNIVPKFPNFEFHHVDIYSGEYNRTGIIQASSYSFPLPDNTFDLAFAVSLFTHMFLPDVQRYFAEMARLLKPGGRLYATYFLMRDEAKAGVSGRAAIKPEYGASPSVTFSKGSPEHMIAHREDAILRLLDNAGFSRTFFEYGNWNTGSPQFPEPYQDTIVVRKR